MRKSISRIKLKFKNISDILKMSQKITTKVIEAVMRRKESTIVH